MDQLKRVLVALDFPSLEAARKVAEPLKGQVGFKVGLELCTAEGTPKVIEALGGDVFLDLKFHDIPNTVEGAVKAAARQRVALMNLHCQGGSAMMRAAVKAADEVARDTGYRSMVIGVTALTSLDGPALQEIGYSPKMTPAELVFKLSALAANCGLDGVVCSPKEAKIVRDAVRRDFLVVTPGIRAKDAPPDDQARTMPAAEAIQNGASHLVIGRPITGAADPVAAADGFLREIIEGTLAAKA